MLRHSVWRFGACAVAAAFGALALQLGSAASAEAATRQSGGGGDAAAESWVRSQVLAGQQADLGKLQGDHPISGSFVADLLTGPAASQIPRFGADIERANIVGPVDLTNADVLPEVRIGHSIFQSTFGASGSHFHQRLTLDSTMFNDDATFPYSQADHGIVLYGATFLKKVDFGYAVVSGQLDAREAHFSGDPNAIMAEFQGMVVTGTAYLDSAVFDGPPDFVYAHFGSLQALDTKFSVNSYLSGSLATDFSELIIDQDALLEGSSSGSGIYFTGATIGRTLVARRVNIVGDAELDFMNVQGNAVLDSWNVGGEFRIRDAKFGGLLKLDSITASAFGLTNSTVSGLLSLRKGVVVKSFVDFRNAVIGTLGLDATDEWPSDPSNVLISGLTYATAQAPYDGIRKLISHATYDADSYRALEAALDRTGDASIVRSVVWEQNSRQRDQWGLSLQSALNFGAGAFYNYGRDPELVLLWTLLAVALGVVVFRPRFMEPKPEPEVEVHPAVRYHALPYSIGVLVPALHLRETDAWQPKGSNLGVTFYYYAHQVFGWVLFGATLLLLSGLTKSA